VLEAERKLSPIEEIFHKHMKKSLTSYEEYYQDLLNKFESSKRAIRDDYASKMASTKLSFEEKLKGLSSASTSSSTPTAPQLAALQAHTIEELSLECERTIAMHEKSWQETVRLLLAAYESFMKDSSPSPSFLPVTLSVVIPAKDITLASVVIRPTDNVKDLKNMVSDRLQLLGNPLVSWGKDDVFVIRSPLAGKAGDIPLIDEYRPILQSHPDPGSQIVLQGSLSLTSDLPKECFTLTFEKSGAQLMDYYSCKDCKFNWICKPCAETCHKGHQVSVYILGHKSTWACCYDPKNSKCKILNSKSRK